MIEIVYELINVAPRFTKAIYRRRFINRVFESIKDAKKEYNLTKCRYHILDADYNLIRVHLPNEF